MLCLLSIRPPILSITVLLVKPLELIYLKCLQNIAPVFANYSNVTTNRKPKLYPPIIHVQ